MTIAQTFRACPTKFSQTTQENWSVGTMDPDHVLTPLSKDLWKNL